MCGVGHTQNSDCVSSLWNMLPANPLTTTWRVEGRPQAFSETANYTRVVQGQSAQVAWSASQISAEEE